MVWLMLSQVFLHFYYVEILLFRFQLLCFSPPHKAVLSKEIRITYKQRLGYSFIKIYKWKLLSFKVVFLIKVERTLRAESHRIATILLLLTTRKGNHTWKYANSISTCQNVTKSLSGQARPNRYGPSAPCERCREEGQAFPGIWW